MGGGRAACAAASELMRWAEGTNLKIKRVDKAADIYRRLTSGVRGTENPLDSTAS
jgi:hypothetical protein